MSKYKPYIIKELRAAVEAHPESENAIAKELGIDQANFNKFLLGKRSLSLETAAILCDYLGLHLAKVRR